jgi:Ni,Fe-hydrogenase III small subunit/NAD-dependent dihydropyrimidine dehydrogenase PreA subunit
MLDILRVRIHQGKQFIPNVKKAVVSEKFRGIPIINDKECSNCLQCLQVCPAKAIAEKPLSIDLGKCVLCGDCERECPKGAIHFTNEHKMASTSRKFLVVDKDKTPKDYVAQAIKARKEIKNLFGKSLKLRQVSAGGCNGCEMELNACSNVNFDMGRFGIDFVASPRHADGVVITGPITENMASALEDAYRSTPEPEIIIAVGSCAISGGIFESSQALNRQFIDQHPIDLYVPGCPIHPLTFINGVLSFLER